jgi:hypothetical protein
MDEYTQFSIQVPRTLKVKAKVRAIELGLSLKTYLTNLVEKDLEEVVPPAPKRKQNIL